MNLRGVLKVVGLFLSVCFGVPEGRSVEDYLLCSHGPMLHDTSPNGIKAWKEQNQRVWKTFQQKRYEDTLQLVGRWPFAGALRVRPSCNFTNDSIIYMSDGSGIRVLKASISRRPQMIGQINCRGILSGQMENGTGVVSRDTFLYVAYMLRRGLQVFSVTDPARPYELSDLPLTGDPTGIALKDSYVIVVGWDSLFRVINVANAGYPRQVALLRLPDYGLGVDIKGEYAFVGCAHAGLVAVDIRNPLNPQQRGQVTGFTGIWVVCDTTRDFAYVAGGAGGLHIINIADPGNLYLVSTLASTPTIDIFKCDTFVYLTGSIAPYQSDLFVVSIANPAQPRLVGQSRADGWSYSACALSPFSYAYTCDGWEGLHVISIANPASPQVDTAMYGAWTGEDLAVQDSFVFYANSWAGLKVLSINDPSAPVEVGSCDTWNLRPEIQTIAVKDSFAYTMWLTANGSTYFRSLDIADPRNPIPCGGQLTSWDAKAIVLSDTFAFVAEDYKFEVYNIAQPRQPVRIGRCDLYDVARGLCIKDTLAYVVPRLYIVSIADPTAPRVLSSSNTNSRGVKVIDTFAYCAAASNLEVWSVVNPMCPRMITCVPLTGIGCDVDVIGRYAYVGSYGMEVFDITDPVSPIRIAVYETPYGVRRIRHDSTYVYAACADGGLCIFRSCTTGVAERPGQVQPVGVNLLPNPTTGIVALHGDIGQQIVVRDVLSRIVFQQSVKNVKAGESIILDLRKLPAGCYFVEFDDRSGHAPLKVILSIRR